MSQECSVSLLRCVQLHIWRRLKVRTWHESDLGEVHLSFTWVEDVWEHWGRSALSCLAAGLCAAPLPQNSTAPGIRPCFYEVKGTEIAVNTAWDNTVQCSQPGEPLSTEVKHCPLLLWDKFCRSWTALGLSRTVLLRVPADKESWTIIYPSYLVTMAQHDTSAFGGNNNNQLKQFAAAYRKPFHSWASQITFVTFLIFLALEAAKGSNQRCFILLLHTRKIKELKPTHVYKALTHPSTLSDMFPFLILIVKCEIFTCLVPLVPHALFKRWREVVRAFTIFLARPVL